MNSFAVMEKVSQLMRKGRSQTEASVLSPNSKSEEPPVAMKPESSAPECFRVIAFDYPKSQTEWKQWWYSQVRCLDDHGCCQGSAIYLKVSIEDLYWWLMFTDSLYFLLNQIYRKWNYLHKTFFCHYCVLGIFCFYVTFKLEFQSNYTNLIVDIE